MNTKETSQNIFTYKWYYCANDLVDIAGNGTIQLER